MVGGYWKRIACRATLEAGAAIGIDSKGRLVIGVLVVIAAVLGLAFWGSQDSSQDELIARLAIAGLFLGLYPFVLLWKVISIPARLHEETQKKIDDLHQKLNKPNLGPDRISLVSFAEIARSECGWTFGNDSFESLDLLDALAQAGVDGNLAFDGRFGAASVSEDIKSDFPLVAIPKELFATGRFNVPMAFDGTNNYDIATCHHTLLLEKTYRDIHLHDKEVALKWLKEVAPKWRGRREKADQKAQEDRAKRIQWIKKDEARLHQSPSNTESKRQP